MKYDSTNTYYKNYGRVNTFEGKHNKQNLGHVQKLE